MTDLIIDSKTDWTPELLERVWKEIEKISIEELELVPGRDLYTNQFEIVSAEQMLDAYSSIGLPVHYNHWSFGKDFMQQSKQYEKGRVGLAYEMVINSNPCVNLLMEENLAYMQTMVMAHAGVGHNAVFANNVYFKEWTQAGSIIDYMLFARDYVQRCEERYGLREVEAVLDAAHALANHSIDKFKRKHRPKLSEEARLKKLMAEDERRQRELDIILQRTTIDHGNKDPLALDDDDFMEEDEENLLYFIMKKSPNLTRWKREILRIVYKVNQYFSPQGQCVTGDNLVANGTGLVRLDELITQEGYQPRNGVSLLTQGNVYTPISHTYLRRQARVLRVQTATGRVFIGTPEHPLMTLQGGTHSVSRLDQLGLADHLVLNINYTPLSSVEVKLTPLQLDDKVECALCGLQTSYLPTHLTQTHGVNTQSYTGELSSTAHRANKSTNLPTRLPSSLTADMAEILAAIESSTFPTGAASTFSLRGDVRRTAALINKTFGLELQPTADDTSIERLVFSSWGLRQFLEQNFKLDCSLYEIRRSTAAVVKSYLRAVVDRRAIRRSDVGTFELPGYDREHLQHLQTLFSAVGIITEIKTGHRMTIAGLAALLNIEIPADSSTEVLTYSLSVVSTFKAKFEAAIGTNLELPAFSGNPRISCADLVPGGKALIDAIREHVKVQREAHLSSTKHMFWAQKKRAGQRLKDQDLPLLTDLPFVRAEELSRADVMANMAQFELACSVPCSAARELRRRLELAGEHFYDRVVSVQELDELRDVYDVTVPDGHLFWMSGLVSHNTKTLNEGMATFCHTFIMQRLEEKGIITSDAYLAYLGSHSGVVYQPSYNNKHYSGPNPYALGFNILRDIRRICEGGEFTEHSKGRKWIPITEEDKRWFPELLGRKWQDVIKEACFEHRDDSFIMQYLSPKVIRDMKLFTVSIEYEGAENPLAATAIVSEIHDDLGFANIRTALARSKERVNYVPQIVVEGADLEGDRTLYLRYDAYMGRELDEKDAAEVIAYLDDLWGFKVQLEA